MATALRGHAWDRHILPNLEQVKCNAWPRKAVAMARNLILQRSLAENLERLRISGGQKPRLADRAESAGRTDCARVVGCAEVAEKLDRS
jgi:hypothetical protein